MTPELDMKRRGVFVVTHTLNPFTLKEAKTGPDNFQYIYLSKVFFEKYLKEKCLSQHYQQLFLKYFVKSLSIPKLFSKV